MLSLSRITDIQPARVVRTGVVAPYNIQRYSPADVATATVDFFVAATRGLGPKVVVDGNQWRVAPPSAPVSGGLAMTQETDRPVQTRFDVASRAPAGLGPSVSRAIPVEPPAMAPWPSPNMMAATPVSGRGVSPSWRNASMAVQRNIAARAMRSAADAGPPTSPALQFSLELAK